jgi:hypothetical protein
MERTEAIKKLRELEGQDLRSLADRYHVPVWKDGKLNKGWAAQVMERHLGLPLNSPQSPNFGSWEFGKSQEGQKKMGGFKRIWDRFIGKRIASLVETMRDRRIEKLLDKYDCCCY